MSTDRPPFHLAFPVKDLDSTRAFYADLLGCPVGRESGQWMDFDFFGHQITAHVCASEHTTDSNPVDGDQVPVRHFGAILPMDAWEEMAAMLKRHDMHFVIEPHIRFAGQVGEQATMFFHDPSGNALEFKAFADESMIFARG